MFSIRNVIDNEYKYIKYYENDKHHNVINNKPENNRNISVTCNIENRTFIIIGRYENGFVLTSSFAMELKDIDEWKYV